MRAMDADLTQRKTARTMSLISLHCICLAEKIAVRGRPKIVICACKCAHTFFELYSPNCVGTQLEVLTIKIYVYIYYIYCKIDKKATIQCSTCYGSDIKAIKLFCSGYICFGIVRHLIRPYNKMSV